MNKIIVFKHLDCLLKDNGINHPEKKERLEISLKSIKEISSLKIDIKEAKLADLHDINLVHPKKYINNIKSFFIFFCFYTTHPGVSTYYLNKFFFLYIITNCFIYANTVSILC